MKKTLILLTLFIIYSISVSGVNLTVEVLNENNNRINSQLEVLKDGSTIKSSSGFLEVDLNKSENYTLVQENPDRPNVTIYNFSISKQFDFKPKFYAGENPEKDFLDNTDPLYYINESINFSKAEIKVKRSQPDSIAECNSIGSTCNSWNVQNTSNFESNYSNSVFRYNVTSFSGYTSGEKDPLPKIQNLSIYNVTGETDQTTGGSLIDFGLNKTFKITQQRSNDYRFSFNITNNGSEAWNFTNNDVLRHEGLNQSWNIDETNDIYYEINGTTYTGGTFSGGNVSWNTGNGGELKVNNSMTAEYIVNVTQDSTNTFNQLFNASTTSGTYDQDLHDLKTKILGYLNLSIIRPLNDTVVQNNKEFTLNGTIECLDGDCGSISSNARRNTSSGFQKLDSTYFTILNKNSSCSLQKGQECTVNWSLNASGSENTLHKLDFNASSNFSQLNEKDTENRLVEIQDIFLINLDWNYTDFGFLDPGANKKPAKRNNQSYNLTVEDDSNEVDRLWIKSSGLNSTEWSNYSIGPGNMTYSETNDYSTSTNFSSSYQLLDKNVDPGTTKNLYYWINVPYGIIKGEYNGTMTFKANNTQ